MRIYEMTKEDFDKVPWYNGLRYDKPFNSIVIIPEDTLHDSGYRCMSFVLADNDGNPLVRASGISDVIDIDGIGGFGNRFAEEGISFSRPIQGWRIDCLPCGYLRLFCNSEMIMGYSLSSFEVFWQKPCAEPSKTGL